MQWDIGKPNPRQIEFFKARARFIAYGGARGGGKSLAVRKKAAGLALSYPGAGILIVRRTFPELRENHILPMTADLAGIARYRDADKSFTFPGGSRIVFGYCSSESDVLQYQGQEYDVIFMDEATQFTEFQFTTLTACLRGANDFPKRFYLTCNPGGIGHLWVKRLFVSRQYRDGETAEDYTFIHATVDDNPQLLAASPEYVQMLDLLPDNVRNAWRFGDWDALSGSFFPEFTKKTHVIEPFWRIPAEWRKYRAFDYGLDMFACLWIAVDFDGRCYVYRELQQSGVIVSEAAKLMLDATPPWEHIEFTIAPPDMWNRQKDSGRSMAELFMENGVGIIRGSNNRVQGWMAVKELLKPLSRPQDRPGLLVTSNCQALISHIAAIQHDEKNPSDCAVQPHEITHICDAIRYFCVTRTLGAERVESPVPEDFEDSGMTDYDDEMTGGEMPEDYLEYGGG